MSTATIPQQQLAAQDARALAPQPQRLLAQIVPIALTVLAICIHGYHPYAEDGGIYLAGIKYLLHPGLYPHFSGFVTAHLHLSCFPYLVAALTRIFGADLMTVMLCLHALSIYLTLRASSAIVEQLGYGVREVRATLCLIAAVLTVPVAGTSLILMDPYVTARSFSTPLSLFAVAAAIRVYGAVMGGEPLPRRSLLVCLLTAVCAALLHPLMGGYGMACIACMGACSLRDTRARTGAVIALPLAALGCAAIVFTHAGAAPLGYDVVARTRTYWFLSQWAWYEWLGVAAPLGILAAFGVWGRSATERLLARGVLLAGTVGLAVSLLFVHAYGSSFAVARLQPLRIFAMVYITMFLLLGCRLASRGLYRVATPLMLLAAAAGMFVTQRAVYPHSSHLEMQWATSSNDWTSAFVWLRDHTATADLIVLDEHYVSKEGEDTQNVRAISERSAIPDYSKDGGIAAIQPRLTRDWADAQALPSLRAITDNTLVSLRSHHADWLVLPVTTTTALPCPYRNATVQVCKL